MPVAYRLSEVVRKINNWLRKEALRANVKYLGLSLDPPKKQQAKVYLFYKPSIYTNFEHLNMLEEKQGRKLRVRVSMFTSSR